MPVVPSASYSSTASASTSAVNGSKRSEKNKRKKLAKKAAKVAATRDGLVQNQRRQHISAANLRAGVNGTSSSSSSSEEEHKVAAGGKRRLLPSGMTRDDEDEDEDMEDDKDGETSSDENEQEEETTDRGKVSASRKQRDGMNGQSAILSPEKNGQPTASSSHERSLANGSGKNGDAHASASKDAVVSKKRKHEASSSSSSSAVRPTPIANPSMAAAQILSSTSTRLRSQARQLPIYEAVDALVDRILANESCVLMAETGSGKSTQVVQMLQEHPKVVEYYNRHSDRYSGDGKRLPTIAITQPRRLPCLSLARRVSEEMGVQLGKEVGYAVRFDARESPERPTGAAGGGGQQQQGRTKIRYCTEGVLLRELTSEGAASGIGGADGNIASENTLHLSDLIGGHEQSAATISQDPTIPPNLLLRYDVIILDEAHERTLNTDFLLGSVKRIQAVRRELTRVIRDGKLDKKQLETVQGLCGGWDMRELKVIVMSATIEADAFSNFFDKCPILYVKGRTYPVTVWHLDDTPTTEDKVELARQQCLSIHLKRPPGDILVFMPGQEEIESLVTLLKEDNKELAPGSDEIMALPLYRVLSQHQQNLVFSQTPNQKRKVIVSTNIAETGLTIPGIKYVVDAGQQKERELFGEGQGTRITSLQSVKCCKSAAEQRAGRAGRTSSGECFRLYAQSDYESRQMSATPEIQRTDLSTVLLQLIAMRQNPVEFPFISPVPRDAYVYSLSELVRLEAISVTKTGIRLTKLGSRMLHYPIQPFRAAILLHAFKLGCASEIIDILALQEAGNPLLESGATRDLAKQSRQKYAHRDGDHLTRLKIFRAYMELASSDSDRTVYMADSGDSSEEESNAARGGDSRVKGPSNAALLAWCKANALNQKVLKEATSVRLQLRDLAKKQKQDPDSSAGEEMNIVLQCLCKGLHANTARLQPDGRTYRQLMGARDIKIHPTSVMFERKTPTVLYDELALTTTYYAHGVSAIEEGWITDNKAFQPAQAS